MVLKISDIKQAIGKKLKTVHFSHNEQKLLLGFEDDLYCQFEVDTAYDDDSPFLSQASKFYWQQYRAETLVQNGVLTAEWVAEQQAQEERVKMEKKEKQERETLALLKQKYEGAAVSSSPDSNTARKAAAELSVQDMADEMEEASRLMQDELGEYWQALVNLEPLYRTGATEEFAAALEEEIKSHHKLLKKDFRLVEKEVTQTYINRRLVHYSEERQVLTPPENLK